MLGRTVLLGSLVYTASASAPAADQPQSGAGIMRRERAPTGHISVGGRGAHHDREFLREPSAERTMIRSATSGAADVIDPLSSPTSAGKDENNKQVPHRSEEAAVPAQKEEKPAALAEGQEQVKTKKAETMTALERSLLVGHRQVGEERRGQDEIDGKIERLSDEQEALYDKLFPEEMSQERVKAVKAAHSILETSGGKAFRIKVPQGYKKLCLTEDNAKYTVRAEPCRKGSSRQKWYWEGKHLKNLHSSERCLGLVHHKTHIQNQFTSLAEVVQYNADAKAQDEAHGLHLSMKYKCSLKHASMMWHIDEKGQLTNQMNRQCMATSNNQQQDAIVMPCNGREEFWSKKKSKKTKLERWFS